MRFLNLDMDILRTLVIATDLGGFVHGAARLGRSQSAVSLQMKKLEEQVGQSLFRKNGRTVALTEAGTILLHYARRLLELNDEAIYAVRGSAIEGAVRLGVPPDFAEKWLPAVLLRFNRAHPNIHVQLQVGRTRDLLEELATGALDLAIAFGPTTDERVSLRARLPLVWLGSRTLEADARTAGGVRLALLDPPCMFREASIETLGRARQPWKLTASSPSLSGLWAMVEAGLGVTVRTALGLPEGVKVLDGRFGLPGLSTIGLSLCTMAETLSPAASRLETILTETLKSDLPAGSVVSGPRAAAAAEDTLKIQI
ncbi:LysR substrate-binding domain-containing protein [Zavarzinia compransoris]|uniref:LysR family transcriptional regulator n=1 Tax=Zavarzinia compransoris TaxID=1264899 RepID=A0A317DUA7_9PROT|nr:LysR substrate-binding domain-containing protein [Zavarzinia compransoris]PWR18259.1 LysR family transcriptional regulator [Zavarzinia compransoris]TDP43685.1 DNA-binding transcriptional LysR family regulator [Zavarzinia compransoris]